MSEINPFILLERHPTRAKAIKAMCAACMGCTKEELEPGFRRYIRDCVSVKCPLHQFRPYQAKGGEDE